MLFFSIKNQKQKHGRQTGSTRAPNPLPVLMEGSAWSNSTVLKGQNFLRLYWKFNNSHRNECRSQLEFNLDLKDIQ